MPPFDTEKECVSLLKKHWNVNCILKAAIHDSVSVNTFRAFHGLPQKPSKVFRKWACDVLIQEKKFQALKNINDQTGYDEWLSERVVSLGQYWEKAMRKSIGFGPSWKLVNLLMKRVALELPLKDRNRIMQFLHVPLDKYALTGVRNLITLPSKKAIPAKATMKFIDNPDDYKCIQGYIRNLAGRAKVPPIAYDYLVWNVD